MEVSIPLAFLAGLASFLSPCVFSLVPAYVGYLGGRAAAIKPSQTKPNRGETFTHGLAFVLGFSFVFILLGVAASFLGAILFDVRNWLARIGGVIVILFGLHMTGLLRIRYLEFDLRPQTSQDLQRSYLSSALMGIFFSAGWSPCVGPTLGTILTLAAGAGNIAEGIQLLTAYSSGLAIPFLASALGIGWVTLLLQKFNKSLHTIEIVMGGILMLVGLLLFLGVYEQLARFGWFIDFGI